MLEVYSFIKFVSFCLVSLYVSMMYSMQTKVLLSVMYMMKRNKRLIYKLIPIYIEEYGTNDLVRYFLTSLYIPLFVFKYIDICLNVVYDILSFVYGKLKLCPVFEPYMSWLEDYMENVNCLYIEEKNKVTSMAILYMKEAVISNFMKTDHLLKTKIQKTNDDKTTQQSHKMKVGISERMRKLKENKGFNKKNK